MSKFLLIGFLVSAAVFIGGAVQGWGAVEMAAGIPLLLFVAALAFRALLKSGGLLPAQPAKLYAPPLSLRRLLLGAPLPTHEMPHQTVGKVVGLAVFASDVLSSVAYATEEILLVLAVAGLAYFGLSVPISIAISALLIMLTISYRQTIFAYPNGAARTSSRGTTSERVRRRRPVRPC